MKLVNFSVSHFRSIIAAHKISVSETTVLIGKNNEGKSNILKALSIAMNLLQEHAKYSGGAARRLSRLRKDHGDESLYFWDRDFPIKLQEKGSKKHSIFRLEFELNQEEIDEFRENIKSNLNGTLPLVIKIGKENQFSIEVSKSGRGSKTLNIKSPKIAKFIADKIAFNYIPAVRTDKEALLVIERMLSDELRVLENNDDYQSALNVISDLQKPILESLANKIKDPLSEFLPNITDVKIEIPEQERRFAMRRKFSVIIDDGTPTNIEFKGDGVKSLAALGLLKNRYIENGASIIAIEEPESHLHPAAIHQLNEIIASLADNSQVIITTHNPLFVDRQDLKSNIIIEGGKAFSAKNIRVIRETLGVKASDNLTNANYVLIVEGKSDEIALKAILPTLSEKVGKALKNNLLIIESIGGASNLSYKLTLMKNALCLYHVFLDNDDEGRKIFEKAEVDGLITMKSCTFVKCRGMKDSELEDCFDSSFYKNIIDENFGVDISRNEFRSAKKWSERMKDTFEHQGKNWNDSVSKNTKCVISEAVTNGVKISLCPHKRNSIDALVESLEKMLKI